MYKPALLLSMFLVLNLNALTNNTDNYNSCNLDRFEECTLSKVLFLDYDKSRNYKEIDINTIDLVEIDEEVNLNFDTTKYLPEGFNALKGKDDLDWSKIELIEIEEEVNLDFDTSKYLPKEFNPLKGKGDLIGVR
ncbi:hypothetical protein RXV94_05530 [Yeosuana sp. MJ-SS3]|uniref:Uncharacterized protein n=1 Tax=Gilvirhabdus luticola TaxID=3079858 RepID=A0ABU3U5K7_9FLAO|nr:hypothetical protein [Yeosuana sp. MJ-SS3]MDU8885611.1 hypothetical protein [Yeosuana sp. MJ-SS3]